MTLQFREVPEEIYEVSRYDADIVLSFQSAGALFIPKDDGSIPIGFQTAIQATTSAVLVRVADGVTLACPVTPFVRPFQTGIMMKTDADFWLLGLGSSGGGGGAIPLPPVLKTAVAGPASITLTWTLTKDPGGSPVTAQTVETSTDLVVWKTLRTFGATEVTAVLNDLLPVATSVRIKALNADGLSDPSNVLSATPAVPVLALTHTGLGEFTITNKSSLYVYTATAAAGTASIDGSIVRISDPNTTATITQTYTPTKYVAILTVTRKAYTYHQGPASCRTVQFYCDGSCPGTPGDGCGCVSDRCLCACSYNSPSCDGQIGIQWCVCEGCPSIRDETPAGFNDDIGEWWRVA